MVHEWGAAFFRRCQMKTFQYHGTRLVTPASGRRRARYGLLFRHVLRISGIERLARTTVSRMGGTAVGAESPMTGPM